MTLLQRLLDRIDAHGPLPFEVFMEIALYDPDGFFGGDTLRSEKAGDFLTSPEVSPLFGAALASHVSSERDRIGEPFELVEVASGSGSLLRPLLEVLTVPTTAVEVSPAARSALRGSLPGVEVTDRLPERIRGVVIANELLDNLPMALAQRVENGWRERWVGRNGNGLELVDAPARVEVIAWLDSYGGDVPVGGWVEVQLAAARWLADVLGRLEGGSVVLFDYGDTAENLVPRRIEGTLRTYRAHHLGPHPLDEPGKTDITADVNFTALLDIARKMGVPATLHRQDDFLAGLGLRDRLSQLRQAELEAARRGDTSERLKLRASKTEAETLLHPRGLGDFRVLVVLK